MGASFGGIAGAVFSATQQFVSPESFGLFESIIVLAMVVLAAWAIFRASFSARYC